MGFSCSDGLDHWTGPQATLKAAEKEFDELVASVAPATVKA